MSRRRIALLLSLASAIALGAYLSRPRAQELPAAGAREDAPVPAAPDAPRLPPLDATQIATGRIAMEHMPREVGSALETFSDEIVKNAEALATRQARITGSCGPGSAIRVIAEDGTVRCQAVPHGAVAVSALAAIPRMSTTTTEVATVRGGAGRYQSGGADDYLIAPVALPDGALVTGLSYTFFDDSDADTEAFLYRSDDQPLAHVASRGASGAVRVESTDAIQLRKIETGRYAYYVYFKVSAQAGARLMPISSSISYRLP